MDSASLAPIGILLLVACLIAMLTRRLGLPYIVGLVVAGFLVTFLPKSPNFLLSRDLVYNVFLPPLVFEAALQLDWRRFKAELPLTLTLAFLGVGMAGLIVAGGMHIIIGWSWLGAALFGILISATDPVSVIAALREMKCEPRAAMVVEAESLLNDGVAAVVFTILSTIAVGASPSAGNMIFAFVWTLGGGILIGAGLSAIILFVVGRTEDPLVEITLTTIAAYGSFLFAEHVHASGIISALCSGLIVGGIGRIGPVSEQGRNRLRWTWEYFAFLANSFVFILIGMSIANQPIHSLGFASALTAILLVIAGRGLSIYPLSLLFGGSRWRLEGGLQHLLFWGGLRGALALALALAVPPTVPERSAIILTAFVVVAFSILVQGLSMPWLTRRLRLDRKDPEATVAAPQG